MKKLIFSLLLFFYASVAISLETTVNQKIINVNYDGAGNSLYFIGGQRWGAPSCPNAPFIYIPSTVSGRKEILSIALAAKVSDKPVRFLGTCYDSYYFAATYIVSE